MAKFKRFGTGESAPQVPPLRRLGGPVGGAQPRVPFILPPNQGPVYGTNATRLRANLHKLGKPAPVIDVSRYTNGFQQIAFNLANSNDVLAVSAPASSQIRTAILLRSSFSSAAGSYLWVSFGTQASDATAAFELPVGGQIWLDSEIPQDDIHIAASIGGVVAVVGVLNYLLMA